MGSHIQVRSLVKVVGFNKGRISIVIRNFLAALSSNPITASYWCLTEKPAYCPYSRFLLRPPTHSITESQEPSEATQRNIQRVRHAFIDKPHEHPALALNTRGRMPWMALTYPFILGSEFILPSCLNSPLGLQRILSDRHIFHRSHCIDVLACGGVDTCVIHKAATIAAA